MRFTPFAGSAPALLRVAAAAAVLALVGCSKPGPALDDVRPVRTITLAAAQSTAVAEFAGEVRPRVESRVGFQVGGRIETRAVEVGQPIRPGQVLATLDASDYRLSAAAAAEQLTAARVDLDQQRADFKRFEELHQQGFISGADLERRRSSLQAAQARHRQAQSQSDVSGNQAAYAVLRAPIAGVVTAIDAEVGQVVAAAQTVVRIAQTADKEVVIAIPESRLQALRQMGDVRVTLWAGGGELRGRVREIAPVADPATRTFTARVALFDAPPTVALGMTATVRFEAPLPAPILTVPLTALLREGEDTYVWRLDPTSMTVSRSAVTVVSVAGNDLVVSGGVVPGDTIVTAGAHLLKEGQSVKRLDSEPAWPAGAPTPIPSPHGATRGAARG
jgi:RND family efflux transporter MFP subunit